MEVRGLSGRLCRRPRREAVTREHVSNTPVPLVYSAHSSDTGEGVRDTPVPLLVYGVPSSSGDERAPEDVAGNGCGASVGGALDLSVGAALLGLVALGSRDSPQRTRRE